jgi:hypothetical protein
MAALPPPTPAAPDAAKAAEDLARPIQVELARLGCAPGRADGLWGDSSRDAAQRFKRHAKIASLDTDEPSQALLDALRDRHSRVCPLECDRGYRARGGVCVEIERATPRRSRRNEERVQERRRHQPVETEVRQRHAPRRAEAPRPAPQPQAPARCVIDLGYGRTGSCDGGR